MATKTTPPRSATARLASAKRPGVREQAAQTTRDNILRAATKVFARYGYEGGSVEKISQSAKSFDRMIYYYFGSKEGLFIEVLEDMYRRMNDAELELDLDLEQPVESLKDVIRFVVTYYSKNPEFITLLNTENLHRGKHIAKSMRAREYSSPAIAIIQKLLESGVKKKVFRADISARNVYLLIAATGYFYISNRHTLSAFLGEDLQTPEALAAWQAFITSTVLRTVMLNP
ncbi:MULTISPECIES: TetR/AcrR family transcriptional regulator [unclassified Polaromonas]|jgi:AcrR family transcriptional regulator|uniref:TetR/AcrR family transcriptional regulator n=1 Tax=unclassified Polaromonas TaxID=2638319 RepID=UPI000BCAE902|nr:MULTISPECIES: TetR/AcrR family transcriptional regulator [unclassified Polaromonas]OYY39705.1 MAG: TetR family transcriptional regulator [Polaromonas sp. 35-63-35]OYZ22450.1 MAG: TetR family transcriptional regulator [Polaromonas sp. 16-63-31]OYZ81330.1 MAG: TetR family transcriptional regulator [Polaromonas sp. 24-63-21]OZA52445.1 MAG: TetR family transcriptional regulator [Polaromonas sp. 17-63-33]OZA88691.1 MAG: TetR family transcriptional regulator [Polaromonas sp. 39-63-25]